MGGLTGVVGGDVVGCDVNTVPPTVRNAETVDEYREQNVAVRSAYHTDMAPEQPIETDEDTLVWVWGEVFSSTDPSGERTTVDPGQTARVCAEQYVDHGIEFVSRLDGEFVGCVYDRSGGTVSFFNDRLGARPLYYVVVGDRVAFSTNIQTVPMLPGFEPAFEEGYLAEYLYTRRTIGTKTPLDGVELLPPATVMTYSMGSGAFDHHQYWEPRYRPIDKPPSYFKAELAKRLKRAVADRMDSDNEHGLLLSGGSDSRAVLSAAESPMKTYHMGDGWTREATIAKRVADAAGVDFTLLDRGPEYHATLLERAAPIMEFLGTFHTGHALGFAEKLNDEVDTLFTGLYSDDLFGTWSIPQSDIRLPSGVTLRPPVVSFPSSIEDFVAGEVRAGPTRQPPFLAAESLEKILSANIQERNGRIEDHGVSYESIETLALSRTLYPITNGVGFDLYSSLQIVPTRNPFLDRRLIDLHLSMPLNYRLRHDPVHRAVQRLDSSLATIPHASTLLPITYPKAAHVVGKRVMNQVSKLEQAGSYRTQGPWQNKDAVIRQHDFVGRALDANEDCIRELPCVDWSAVRKAYHSHLTGEADVGEELYRLLTVLEMPLTKRILDCEPDHEA